MRTIRNSFFGILIITSLLLLIFGSRLSHLEVPIQSGVGIPVALNETGMWRVSNKGNEVHSEPELYSHVDVPIAVAGIKLLTSGTLRTGDVRLNAPYKYNQKDFPSVMDRGNELLILSISKFTNDPIVNLNSFYLLTFFLNYLAFSFGLYYWLGRLSWFVVLVSVVFAFTPFHFIQGQFYIMNQIGLIICTAVLLRIISKQAVSKKVLVAGACITAAFGLYWCFFSILLVSLALLINIHHREIRLNLIRFFTLIFLTSGLAAYIDFSPSLNFWSKYGINETIHRTVAQTEVWSFRTMDLLLLPSYAKFAPDFLLRNVALSDSGILGEASGLFSPLGILILMFCFFQIMRGYGLGQHGRLEQIIHRDSQGSRETFSFLVLGVIFIPIVGSMGGLGPILNLLSINPIKSWERLSVVYEVLGLSLVALILHVSGLSKSKSLRVFKRINLSYLTKHTLSLVFVFSSVLTLVWSIPLDFDKNFSFALAHSKSDRDFFVTVEKELEGSKVFTFPVEIYPEGPEVCRSIPYASLTGFMYTTKTRWSGGAIKGRDGMWQAAINAMPIEEATNRLADMGFSGLIFDGSGFSQGAYLELVKKLEVNSSSPLLFSRDSRWVFVRIENLLNKDSFSKSIVGFKRIVRPKEETAKLIGSAGLLSGSYTCPSR